jgi:hypothetical protein
VEVQSSGCYPFDVVLSARWRSLHIRACHDHLSGAAIYVDGDVPLSSLPRCVSWTLAEHILVVLDICATQAEFRKELADIVNEEIADNICSHVSSSEIEPFRLVQTGLQCDAGNIGHNGHNGHERAHGQGGIVGRYHTCEAFHTTRKLRSCRAIWINLDCPISAIALPNMRLPNS